MVGGPMENYEIINKLHQAVKRINDLETELENIKQKNSWNFANIGKKRLISSLIVVGLLLSIVVIAGTVTKPHTFSDGTVISASQVNANFDTLFTLVNGNLTSENIASIDASDITTGTIDAARIPNLDASKITAGTIDSSRIATSTTAAPSKIILFTGGSSKGSGINFTENCIKKKIALNLPVETVRPFRSMQYSNIKDIIPDNLTSLPVYGPTGVLVSSTWTGLWDGNTEASFLKAGVTGVDELYWWSGSLSDGTFDSTYSCGNWTDLGVGDRGTSGTNIYSSSQWITGRDDRCDQTIAYICVAW